MIFSILAFLSLFIGICIKDRKMSLKIQSLKCFFESIYAITISAYTVAGLGLLNFIRTTLFSYKDKFSKYSYLTILFLFEGIIIINCIYTWNGFISLLPTLASATRTFCMWQSNMKYVRLSAVLAAILFGGYYIYYQGWFMLAGYILLFIISCCAVLKHDIKLLNSKILKVKKTKTDINFRLCFKL